LPDLRRLPALCFLRELFNNGFLSQVKKNTVRTYGSIPVRPDFLRKVVQRILYKRGTIFVIHESVFVKYQNFTLIAFSLSCITLLDTCEFPV
jgi:hypothetical protein